MLVLFLVIPCLLSCNLFSVNTNQSNNQSENSKVETDLQKPEGKNTYFIHLSDVHLNSTSTKTDSGEDTGLDLWANAKKKLTGILNSKNPPQFVVYTGDLPAHDDMENLDKNIKTILTDLRNLFASNKIPFFYLPGNNDSLAGDYFSFTDSDGETPLSLVSEKTNPFPALNTAQSCGTSPCLDPDPKPKMGYYAASPISGLRIIALNSIIWGKTYNEVDGISQLDAGNNQMKWLTKQLDEAAKAKEKVYLLMHIPPGIDAFSASEGSEKPWMWAHLPSKSDSWLNQFLKLSETHQATIAGILYGHTHMDELRLIYSPDGTKITEVAISAPGITPKYGNNPGFKTVSFDSNSKELTDFETHYSTRDALAWGDKSYKFSTYYTCGSNKSNIYDCLSAMSPDQVNKAMQNTYKVRNGNPSYDTKSGIEVKSGQ